MKFDEIKEGVVYLAIEHISHCVFRLNPSVYYSDYEYWTCDVIDDYLVKELSLTKKDFDAMTIEVYETEVG